MAYISDESIQRVKDAVDIVDLIGDYVELKRSGKNHKGLCPFHNEKTPSFVVTEERGTFHCFGCHEQGDAISFIMKIHHLDFVEAVRHLADRYGIDIEEKEGESVQYRRNQKLYEINKAAMMFYYKNLLTNKIPQNYLQGRNFKSSIINDFMLGYADGRGDSLYQHLLSLGYEVDDLLHLGLISKSNRGTGYYDRFRNRLIFPIISKRNKVIGFGARIIGQGQPKYLNSPDSDIFHKGENLYGIHILQNRRERDKVLLVEGYMDVIALKMYGIDYAVASLGTALTPDQASLAHKYGKKVYLCYDGDNAGIQASRKAIEVFKDQDIIPEMVLLPDGQDPDDYCQEHGVEALQGQMKEAVDPIDFELRILRAGFDLDNEKDRLDYILEATDFLAGIEHEAVRDVYIQKVAQEVQVDFESLKKDIQNKEDRIRRQREEERQRQKEKDAYLASIQNPDQAPYEDLPPPVYEGDYSDNWQDEGDFYSQDYDQGKTELNQREMGNTTSTRLTRERAWLEYEVVRLYQADESCRQALDSGIVDFVQDEDKRKILGAIQSLCGSQVPPELGHLKNSLRDEESQKILRRLEADESQSQDQNKETWEANAKELEARIHNFTLRERRSEIHKLIMAGQRPEGQDLATEDLLKELMEIDAELKGDDQDG